MNTFKKEIKENWLTECLSVWDFSHYKYFNWIGIVTRDNNGFNKYEWLKISKNSDEYFNFAPVKKGDILYAGCKNKNKNYPISTAYYGVVEKTEDYVELVKDTTYLKVKNILKSILELD